jgi:nucleoside recognition membrane protein YjiH
MDTNTNLNKELPPQLELEEVTMRQVLRFIIPSIIGVLLFLTPFIIDGRPQVIITVLIDFINVSMKPFMLPVCIFVTVVPAILSVIVPNVSFLKNSNNRLVQLFNPTWPWALLRMLGAISITLIYFKIGPEWIWHRNTGGVMLLDIAPVILAIYFLSALLMPLLTNYGLMEFIGVLFNKSFSRVFGLPGHAAVDAIASWMSASSVGIMLTTQQYKAGHYTQKEASIISTNFSVVAIAFAYVVLSFIKLEHLFIPWYLSVVAVGIICAMIVPKLPPLRNLPNIYCSDAPKVEPQVAKSNGNVWQLAFSKGIARANSAPSIKAQIKDGLLTASDVTATVFPSLMIIGVAGLALVEYTSIISTLALPLVPLLEILQLPEAPAAATAIMSGLIDMLMPAILGASIESELTRFVIAGIAINGIIFLSEVAIILVRANIGLNIFHLLVIWLIRVLIALPLFTILGRFVLSMS